MILKLNCCELGLRFKIGQLQLELCITHLNQSYISPVTCELIDELDHARTNILASSNNNLVLLAGDLNQLSDGLIT